MMPLFENTAAAASPFPHAVISRVLTPADAAAALQWLQGGAPWSLRLESFYEQYEFSLLETDLPEALRGLLALEFIQSVRDFLRDAVGAEGWLELVDVSAHKLVAGQTIRVHNDFIGGEETHRLIVQLNSGWSADNGGILMLFDSDSADDVSGAFMPIHGSGFAFEISPRSYHAVSTIRGGERYTLVYTFRALAA